jgi:hypothetical protein
MCRELRWILIWVSRDPRLLPVDISNGASSQDLQLSVGHMSHRSGTLAAYLAYVLAKHVTVMRPSGLIEGQDVDIVLSWWEWMKL